VLRSAIQLINSLLQRITFIFVVIAGGMTVLMIFVTTYGVVARYFFRRPEPLSYEVGTILLLWGFLFAVAFVEWRQEHIRADIFVAFMPESVAHFLHRIVSPILALLYCSVLTWKGWDVAMYSLKIGEKSMSVVAEPLFPIKIMIPICYGLMTFVVLRNLCRGIAAYSSPSEKE